jgi:hypothetical protein
MTAWKRLTDGRNNKVEINMDNVTYMVRDKDHNVTIMYFVGGSDPRSISVSETIDTIQEMTTIKS